VRSVFPFFRAVFLSAILLFERGEGLVEQLVQFLAMLRSVDLELLRKSTGTLKFSGAEEVGSGLLRLPKILAGVGGAPFADFFEGELLP